MFATFKGGSVASRIPRFRATPGILSTSELEADFRREQARAERYSRPFSMVRVVVGDLPDRKHRRIAKVLQSTARLGDSCGYLGPEEFGVLLVDTDHVGARDFCVRFQRELDRQGLRVDQTIFRCGPKVQRASQAPSVAPHPAKGASVGV